MVNKKLITLVRKTSNKQENNAATLHRDVLHGGAGMFVVDQTRVRVLGDLVVDRRRREHFAEEARGQDARRRLQVVRDVQGKGRWWRAWHGGHHGGRHDRRGHVRLGLKGQSVMGIAWLFHGLF